MTSADGILTILSVDGGARLHDDPRSTAASLPGPPPSQELVGMLATSQEAVNGIVFPQDLDVIAAHVLGLPRSARWRDALRTALVGDWSDALYDTGYLPVTALGALKAQARTVHRQLVPLWKRRTRHGRVLSLDAEFEGGMSLYDLVAADVDLLAPTRDGVFEDNRLNRVLGGLAPAERAVVLAYAEGSGTRWTEAAAAVGAAEPGAFGERVRRKASGSPPNSAAVPRNAVRTWPDRAG